MSHELKCLCGGDVNSVGSKSYLAVIGGFYLFRCYECHEYVQVLIDENSQVVARYTISVQDGLDDLFAQRNSESHMRTHWEVASLRPILFKSEIKSASSGEDNHV